MRVLAVTDHDSTEGLAEAIEEAAAATRRSSIVPGIEINCDVEGGEIHILGYCMDYEAAVVPGLLPRPAGGAARARAPYGRAARPTLGMPIDAEAVFALVQEGSAGRPHVAQVMVERGYVKTRARGLRPLPRPRASPATSPARSSRPRTRCGCCAVPAACPSSPTRGSPDRDALIPSLVAAGLMGIECYYREHSAAQTRRLRRALPPARPGRDRRLRFPRPAGARSGQLGDPSVPLAVWEALQAKAAEARASRPA